MARKVPAAQQEIPKHDHTDFTQQSELPETILRLEKENAELKAAQAAAAPKAPAADKAEGLKGVTIQHIKPMRMWTVHKDKVLKVHRGTGKINNPRFEKNVILTPGCIVTVAPDLAKALIKSKDFQKYGIAA